MQKVYFHFILFRKCQHYTAKPPVAIILGGDVTLQVSTFHSLMVSIERL